LAAIALETERLKLSIWRLHQGRGGGQHPDIFKGVRYTSPQAFLDLTDFIAKIN
jgi:hypothetical protein